MTLNNPTMMFEFAVWLKNKLDESVNPNECVFQNRKKHTL